MIVRPSLGDEIRPLIVSRVVAEPHRAIPWLADFPEEDLVVGAAGLVIARGRRPGEPRAVAAETREVFVAKCPRKIDQRVGSLAVRATPRDARAAVSFVAFDPDQPLLPRPPCDLTMVAREHDEASAREVVDAE